MDDLIGKTPPSPPLVDTAAGIKYTVSVYFAFLILTNWKASCALSMSC